MFRQLLPDGLIIQNPVEEFLDGMSTLQRKSFPTLAENELLTSAHFAKHLEIFPQGQFVIISDSQVIGSTSTFLTDFPKHSHTFLEATGNLWITTHNPKGKWLYGFDMSVDHAFRGKGLSRLLYKARHDLCRLLGAEGQVVVGMPSGYGAVRSQFSIDEYLHQLECGERFDPTVSIQKRIGFEIVKVIPDHLHDPRCDNYGVLMKLPVHKDVELH